MNYISFNGNIVMEDQPVLFADNRGYRYGDGLFETMKLLDGTIGLAHLHFDRLFTSLPILKFKVPKFFTVEKLEEEIRRLCQKNGCEKAARIRLSVFRGDGGIYDETRDLQYIIESWPLTSRFDTLNENGLVIGIYPDARKSCDTFSSLKSANYLPYVMAAQFVKENKWNDALILNQYDRIADATIANVFIIKDNTIITPSLEEGCVNGVMRRYLLESFKSSQLTAHSSQLTAHDIETADEIFLTNAIHGIRWVARCGKKTYGNQQTQLIYNTYIQTIYR